MPGLGNSFQIHARVDPGQFFWLVLRGTHHGHGSAPRDKTFIEVFLILLVEIITLFEGILAPFTARIRPSMFLTLFDYTLFEFLSILI